KPYAPRSLAEFRLLPGAAAAVGKLRDAGFLIVVVTNQPDIGNGQVAAETVMAMHDKLRRTLAPDAIEICPHRQDEGCDCRKPRPGMLLRSASRLGIDLARSFMVGDRGSDVVAGQAVGCYTLLVARGPAEGSPDAVVGSLPAAVAKILDLTAGDRNFLPP
ncbi:MAG: D-alpha,beta-D-heptose 1,7-bisphosphate phosphatase, partial [Rhodospirillales bacterium]|nr:D-alpha,beta-D-heptose 1,7-bisphosphate phosphatase [Rhodospirillales bacterium]